MKKLFAIIVIFVVLICKTTGGAMAQSTSEEHYMNLVAQQTALRKSQDSLQSLLGSARQQLGSASEEQKTAISGNIVRFEGELFDVRSRISRLGSEIAAIEEKYAESTLTSQERMPTAQSAVLYQNPFFLNNLSNKDISVLASQQKIESDVAKALDMITPLYDQLKEYKVDYDQSNMQSEVDETRAKAAAVKEQITSIDETVGKQWNALYNYLLDTYLVMLDKAPNKDRSDVESIEIESREVRRAETFLQNGNLAPQLAAFDQQRKLLLSYQKAIAKAAGLTDALHALSSRKIQPVNSNFPDIEFLPRVLTVYGPAMLNYTYPSDNVTDIPEMIIPEKGVYYSIQISLMSNPAKSVDMFKKVWPIQWQKTSDGKYRYLVGGFHSYEAAMKSVSTLSKAGFKYPVLLAWNNGSSISTSKAKALEKPLKAEGDALYKIVVLTKNPASAEIVKNTVEMHAKGKSIIRLAKGDHLQFTINDFVVREEAEVLAQILRERTEANVTVEEVVPDQE